MDRHEVPTHLDVEDRLFWGMTLPRLFGVVTTLGAAYGLYSRFPWASLGMAESPVRWVLPGALALVGLALSLLRPLGRPLAAWLVDLTAYAMRPRHFTGPLLYKTSLPADGRPPDPDKERRP